MTRSNSYWPSTIAVALLKIDTNTLDIVSVQFHIESDFLAHAGLDNRYYKFDDAEDVTEAEIRSRTFNRRIWWTVGALDTDPEGSGTALTQGSTRRERHENHATRASDTGTAGRSVRRSAGSSCSSTSRSLATAKQRGCARP